MCLSFIFCFYVSLVFVLCRGLGRVSTMSLLSTLPRHFVVHVFVLDLKFTVLKRSFLSTLVTFTINKL